MSVAGLYVACSWTLVEVGNNEYGNTGRDTVEQLLLLFFASLVGSQGALAARVISSRGPSHPSVLLVAPWKRYTCGTTPCCDPALVSRPSSREVRSTRNKQPHQRRSCRMQHLDAIYSTPSTGPTQALSLNTPTHVSCHRGCPCSS